MGQEPEKTNSCGTTQIGAKTPAHFRISNNMRSPDNGWSPPSQILGHAAFRLALLKSIHKGLPCRDLTTHGSLGSLVSLLLVFVIGLSVWSQYILIQSICQAHFEKKYKLLS